MPDTTLTDTERRYAYEHFGDDDEHFGRCYLEADVESIVAARVAAARANERAKWESAIRAQRAAWRSRADKCQPWTHGTATHGKWVAYITAADELGQTVKNLDRALIEGADQ